MRGGQDLSEINRSRPLSLRHSHLDCEPLDSRPGKRYVETLRCFLSEPGPSTQDAQAHHQHRDDSRRRARRPRISARRGTADGVSHPGLHKREEPPDVDMHRMDPPPQSAQPYNTYLHSLAPIYKGETRIYYSKYILGIIGELDFSTKPGKVREWTFPPQLYTSSMSSSANLVRLDRTSESDSIWFALEEYHGGIGSFRPQTGLFTLLTTKTPMAPIRSPKDVRFDGKGNLWFVGGSTSPALSTLSRINPAGNLVDYWVIPEKAMLNVLSIFPNRAGDKVWISSVDPNIGSTRQWIGVLDVASGVLTCFSPKPYPDSPRSIDIALHEKPGDDSVWFSAATGAPAIYRFDVGHHIFEKHTTTSSSWPRYLALEATGSAWATDINGNSIIFCPKGKSCGEVIFQSKKFTLEKARQKLTRKELKVQPTMSKAPSQAVTVTKKEYPCALEYQFDALNSPDQIQLQYQGKKTPALFYVSWGANRIGMLTP